MAQGLPIKRSLATGPRASRRLRLGGTAIRLHSPRPPHSPRPRPRPRPLRMSVRSPARQGRRKHRVPRRSAATHRKAPRKHRWVGAATPTQRNTIRPQEPPRRASDLFNGINMLRKDNPRWPTGNALETITVQVTGGPTGSAPASLAGLRGAGARPTGSHAGHRTVILNVPRRLPTAGHTRAGRRTTHWWTR